MHSLNVNTCTEICPREGMLCTLKELDLDDDLNFFYHISVKF